MNATFVSVWDGGTRIESPCQIDLSTREVSEVGQVEVESLVLDFLEEELIVLPDGSEIRDFILDGETYVNGIPQYSED